MLAMPVIWFQALLHGYIACRLAPDLPDIWLQGLCVVLLLASAVLIPVSYIGHRRRGGNRRAADRLTWAGFLALGHLSMLFVLTVLRDLLLLLALPFDGPAALATWTAIGVPLLAIGATLLGLVAARRTAKLRRVDVPMVGLPAALHGFTIAQISDLHIGPTVKASYVQAVVDSVNGVGADVVAITGDLIDGGVDDLHHDVQPLAGHHLASSLGQGEPLDTVDLWKGLDSARTRRPLHRERARDDVSRVERALDRPDGDHLAARLAG